MKVPRCLERRKRHYFGQHRNGSRGPSIPNRSKCVWCGWDRGYVYEGFWPMLLMKANKAIKGDERARNTVIKETTRIIKRGQVREEEK